MKGIYIVTVLGGAVGGASIFYFHKRGGSVETLRSKFSGSLIKDGETNIWDSKWETLKKGPISGNNANLKLAFSKKGDSDSNSGKDALKQGCKELYDSPFISKEDKNFLDFKNYCSKSNKDKGAASTWITQEYSDGAWATKWTNLKQHTGDIDPELGIIKGKASISGQDVERQKEIKTWCDKVSVELFESESVRYNNFLTYCKT
ncbi:hypothetical protein MHC_00820 [Mycoplasma haemocanis str. Illinois]|uniref:Uncharacterized protein n=1 Tax=Mycoplasma haemocanis (strain Illinois) TaxID=1111676 RepID=H6N5S0_MYCHN|nr:hypothetical protein [Mycoplasma haemocanis]AEW45030.1 hypothetical protein MHC_00820 [Mycoplasma haemocanis str. Illinois]